MFLRATSTGSPAGIVMAAVTVGAAVVVGVIGEYPVVVVVVGAEDWCLATTALSIVVPVDPANRSSISIAFELVSRAPGDGGSSGGGRRE